MFPTGVFDEMVSLYMVNVVAVHADFSVNQADIVEIYSESLKFR